MSPANLVTALRALIVAFIASLLVWGSPTRPIAWVAVAAATAAAVLDGVDGWIARRTRSSSALGARLDMETDAAFILVLAVVAWRWQKAGPWVVLSGLLRYLFVAAGWIWPWLRAPLAPTSRARIICVVQIVALIVAIGPIIPWPLSAFAAGIGLAALVYSFAVDTRRLWGGTA